MASEEFSKTLFAVIAFLREEGFLAAEQSLVAELANHAGSSSGDVQALLSAMQSPRGAQGQGDPGLTLGDAPSPSSPTVPLGVGLPPEFAQFRHGAASRKLPSFSEQSVPWDEALNEYDTAEDVGYQRRDVAGQALFLENEVVVDSQIDPEGGQHASNSAAQHLSSTANTSGAEFGADDSDEESTCESSISGGVIDLMPASASAQHSSSHLGAHGGFATLELLPTSSADAAWDMGPMDIRIAEPVTTPSKSSGNAIVDEPRPVLSRVESLSSSFKDFDIECNDEDMPSRRVSGNQDPSSIAFALQQQEPEAAAEVIDFQPVLPLVPPVPPLLGPPPAAAAGAAEPSSSGAADVAVSLLPAVVELTPGPALPPAAAASPPVGVLAPSPLAPPAPEAQPFAAAAAAAAVGDVALAPPVPSQEPTPAGASPAASEGKAGASGSGLSRLGQGGSAPTAVEGTSNVGGGFSFPVAAAPAEAQPDHRLFKSWPSVRSSCTSEVINAASDDDHVAADYADDEYLKSVSKPTSRSTSQNLGEFGKAGLRAGLGEEEMMSGSQSGLEGWSFASPTMQAASSGGHKPELLPREPGHDRASAPSPSKQNMTASCISEPSTSLATSYNTCLPAGLLGLATANSSTAALPTGTASSPASTSQFAQGRMLDAVVAARGSTGGASTQQGTPGTTGRRSPGQPLGAPSSPPLSPSTGAAGEPPWGGSGDLLAEEQYHDALSGHHGDHEELLTDDMTAGGDDDSALEAAAALEWEQLHVHAGPSGAMRSSTGGVVPPGSPLGGAGSSEQLSPRYTVNEDGSVTYEYDAEYVSRKYEVLELRVYHRRNRTGFEETKDFPIRMHDLIAGRYQVVDFLGSAAFSRAVQALDIKTNLLVCLKIIKNNKDYLDQSLDEIKLLKYVNTHDPEDKFGIVRLYDYFYYKEHLFLVCELLRANLYEFQKYNRESGDAPYFTNARIQRIAQQVLRSLSFLHALGLIHSDLKPENILIKSYSKCEVKVIDLGSSCFVTDQLSSYVQSRSYRAPEVILGLPYDQKVDVWSLGCILAELSSGQVLFQNDSVSTLLARLEGILGPLPQWMIRKGRYTNRFYTRSGQLYEKNATSERYELLMSKRTSLRHRVPDADEGLLSFVAYLLHVDPNKRPSALQALQHPWLQVEYPPD